MFEQLIIDTMGQNYLIQGRGVGGGVRKKPMLNVNIHEEMWYECNEITIKENQIYWMKECKPNREAETHEKNHTVSLT